MPWDYDKTQYDTQKAKDVRWHLERLINYGLGDEKLDRELLKQHLPYLKIGEERKKFLALLLWGKNS